MFWVLFYFHAVVVSKWLLCVILIINSLKMWPLQLQSLQCMLPSRVSVLLLPKHNTTTRSLVSSLSFRHFHFISRTLLFLTNAAVFPPYLVILCEALNPILVASAYSFEPARKQSWSSKRYCGRFIRYSMFKGEEAAGLQNVNQIGSHQVLLQL